MAFNPSVWANKLFLTIDSTKVDGDLTDFPVLIPLSSGTGITGFDATAVFDELCVPVTLSSGVVLLLHCDTLDSSSYEHDVTAVGNPTMASGGKFGGCAEFDGTDDCFTLSADDSWNFGSGDFTIDFWMYATGASDERDGLVGIASSSSDYEVHIGLGGSSTNWATGGTSMCLSINYAGAAWGAQTIGSANVCDSTLHHIALTKTGTSWKLYVDGVEDISITYAFSPASGDLIAGAHITTDRWFSGKIDELRVSKGIRRWTADFSSSLPTQPYTDDAYTSALLHFDIIDSSLSAHEVTVQNTKAQAATGKMNGCYYFDGTGDFLNIPDSSDFDLTSIFTIDFWFNTGTASQCCLINTGDANNANEFQIELNRTAGKLSVYSSGQKCITTNSWNDNAWHHCALVCDGTDLKMYIDGTKDGEELAYAPSWTPTGMYIGATYVGTEYYTGYIDELRIIKGSAYWTENFIPLQFPYGHGWFNRKKIAVTTTVSGQEEQLYTEIERWDCDNEQAWLWTKVPTINSGTDIVLNFYYDVTQTTNSEYVGDSGETAAQNVWDSNFVAVYHLAQDLLGGTNSVYDSTSNTNHATPQAGIDADDWVAGVVGKATHFDGTGVTDKLDITTSTDFEFGTDNFTIEHIIYPEGNGTVFCNYEAVNKLHAPFFDNSTSARVLINGSNYLTGITPTASIFQQFFLVRTGNDLKAYIDDVQEGITGNVTGVSVGADTKNYIGSSGYGGHAFTGIVDELRVSNTDRAASWRKATRYSSWDDFITFEGPPAIIFTFSNPVPTDSGIIYVGSQVLQLTATVSGEDPSYTYDAIFYNADGDVQIGSTVAGVNSGSSASSTAGLPTPSGGIYDWYMEATSSGQSDTSPTYQFDRLFSCAGTVEIDGTPASGIPVRLYRRDTGALIGEDLSTGVSGTFEIDTTISGYFYAVALYATTVSGEDATDTNALIYDWLIP